MEKLAALIDFLNRYCVAYQIKYSMLPTSQVSVEMLAKDQTLVINYLIPSTVLEPTISVGQYWINGYSIRKCVSNNPSGQLLHTYVDITDFNAEFGYDVQLVSESIDVGPNAPIPAPITVPGKGSFQVSDGTNPVNFNPGTNGFVLVSNSNSSTGLSWGPIVSLNGTEVLGNKTLISPRIDGVFTGNAVLNEDNMISNSVNKVPTQRSVKRYVDNTIQSSIVAVKCLKLNVFKTSDGVFAALDNDAVYKKGTETLSHEVSLTLTPGVASSSGNVSFDLDVSGMSIGVSSTDLTVSGIFSVNLVYANIGKSINPRIDLSNNQLQFSFTDLNGVPVKLTEMTNNSMIETLVSFS